MVASEPLHQIQFSAKTVKNYWDHLEKNFFTGWRNIKPSMAYRQTVGLRKLTIRILWVIDVPKANYIVVCVGQSYRRLCLFDAHQAHVSNEVRLYHGRCDHTQRLQSHLLRVQRMRFDGVIAIERSGPKAQQSTYL